MLTLCQTIHLDFITIRLLHSAHIVSLRTLFKFVKKFEAALSGPSVPALVEQGTSASLDSVDTNPEETPIHRVHKALKSTLPGKGRDLQVQVSTGHRVISSHHHKLTTH